MIRPRREIQFSIQICSRRDIVNRGRDETGSLPLFISSFIMNNFVVSEVGKPAHVSRFILIGASMSTSLEPTPVGHFLVSLIVSKLC